LQGSNGLAFSPDERVLYVVESRASPHRKIWAYDVEGPRLANKRLFVDADGPGAYDGIAVDVQGNVWCGFGSDGAPGADPEALDGVRVYDARAVPLAHIHLPERCANLCFGGRTTTACSWPPAIRSTLFTSTRVARSEGSHGPT
jgi:gluconolactonase